MSSALYIAFEKDVDFETFVNGKALSHHLDTLDEIAAFAGVTPLMEFFSANPNDFLDEVEQLEIAWTEQWFEANTGLETVNALLLHFENQAPAREEHAAIIEDLREFQQVLNQAAAQNVRWHLAVDY